ncbi:AbrB/MazE/SpoVT family DNA-binding domain-containing protein [Patescibacteria group bacterium]
MKKGKCGRMKKFYGMVTMTERGQIVIPTDIRKDLDVKNGDKLMVVKRKDGKGINLIKSETIEEFLNSVSVD